MKEFVTEEIVTKMDADTGEITSETKTAVKRLENTPDFIMVFTDSIGEFAGLTGGESALLFGILGEATKNNEVVLNKTIKDRIALRMGINSTSINPMITRIVKSKMLLKNGRGVYLLNPNIFGKGSWRDIKKLRMMLEVDVEAGKLRKGFEVEMYENKIEK